MKTSGIKRKLFSVMVYALAVSALGDVNFTTSFEPAEGYTNGPIDGQQGWIVTQGLSDFSSANVVSGLALDGSQSLIFNNQYLVTQIIFNLRKSFPIITLNSNRLYANIHWTPISGQIHSSAGWRLIGTNAFFGATATVASGQTAVIYASSSVGLAIGQGVYGISGDYTRWNHLSCLASFGKTYPTGEVISWCSNYLANSSGSAKADSGAVVADFPDPMEWLEFTVFVQPQSSVALDLFDITVQPSDTPITNAPPKELAVDVKPAMRITWPSRIGYEYQLQWTDQLVSSNWYDLGATTTGSDSTTEVLVPIEKPSPEYFRVKEWPKP